MTDSILIIDDDPVQCRLLEGLTKRMGYMPAIAQSGDHALRQIEADRSDRFRAIILDLVMPDMDGIAVLRALRDLQVSTPVIVQTAQGGIETVVEAMRAGAFDFVVKPVSPERLKASLAKAVKIGTLEDNRPKLKKTTPESLGFSEIISTSPAMASVLKTAEKAAQSDIPVLIEGESGVGKELIARAIQSSSRRSSGPFISVNCGALPENLAESILFGHEKGTFTGASNKQIGKFEEANGGTLFLDEIGELPPDTQVKLLRAIQEGEIDPIGARRPVNVDIRIISATNRNLIDDVRKGRFREDLYYRLSVLPLTIPPLRNRRGDIPLLTRHFINRFATEENGSSVRGITGQALAILCAHDWPGNIRELENAIFRAVVLSETDELAVGEFPHIAAQVQGYAMPGPEPAARDIMIGPVSGKKAPAMHLAANPLAPSMDAPDHAEDDDIAADGYLPLISEKGDVRRIDEMEPEIIRFAIRIYSGQMSEVARRLGIGRSTLYRKLKDYGIEDARQDILNEK
jgi:DNA-binding NtrC family response regulator